MNELQKIDFTGCSPVAGTSDPEPRKKNLKPQDPVKTIDVSAIQAFDPFGENTAHYAANPADDRAPFVKHETPVGTVSLGLSFKDHLVRQVIDDECKSERRGGGLLAPARDTTPTQYNPTPAIVVIGFHDADNDLNDQDSLVALDLDSVTMKGGGLINELDRAVDFEKLVGCFKAFYYVKTKRGTHLVGLVGTAAVDWDGIYNSPLIDKLHRDFSLERACWTLRISRSWKYGRLNQQDLEISGHCFGGLEACGQLEAIRKIHADALKMWGDMALGRVEVSKSPIVTFGP